MPESPREGEPSPTSAYVGALGGYPPLGDQVTPEPAAPKKRSSRRWLAPLIVGLVIVVAVAVIAIVYLTAPHN
jgi:hypothetical protein